MIDKRERVFQAFGGFLNGYIRDLNHMSEDGWGVLVEGKRDESALRKLGYKGPLATSSTLAREGVGAFGGCKKVVILTDLDREGSVLASRYLRRLSHEGIKTSLSERRRLKQASRGVFLHVENLSRFAESGE